jgi:hypothetical protein
MKHFHWYKKVGAWDGYWGLKMCRCGGHKLYDLWGFAHDVSYDEQMNIIAELRKEAGR